MWRQGKFESVQQAELQWVARQISGGKPNMKKSGITNLWRKKLIGTVMVC
jgi:hypothetical protein